MLPFQVGAIDPNRPGNWGIGSKERGVRVNRRYRRWILSILLIPILTGALIAAPQVSGQSKGRKKKASPSAKAGASPAEQSLTNIPLPIGHEAKGLVLPDFDTEGRLKGRFEAGTARRIDQEHVGFQNLKITTYTPENQTDLRIDMQTSVLDLKTRILSSQERTTIHLHPPRRSSR